MPASDDSIRRLLSDAVDDSDTDPRALVRRAEQAGRRRRRRTLIASTLLPAVAVAAVTGGVLITRGTGDSPAPASGLSPSPTPSGYLMYSGHEPLISCNSESFTPSVARNGLPGSDPKEFVPALDQLVQKEGWSVPEGLARPGEVERADWRVAARTDSRAMILYGAVADPTTFQFVREGRGWKAQGMGGCRAFATVPADQRRTWLLDLKTAGPTPRTTDTRITLSGAGSTCTTADETVVKTVETATSVTIYATEPRVGLCNAAARLAQASFSLSSPLGSRALLDGSVWPPRPLRTEK